MTSNDPAAPADSPHPPAPADSTGIAAPAEFPDAVDPADSPDPTAAAVSLGAVDPTATALQERLGLQAEDSLAALYSTASHVSAMSGGIRFSTLQKTQASLAAELRLLRAQPVDETVLANFDGLLQKIDRLIAALSPPPGRPKADSHPLRECSRTRSVPADWPCLLHAIGLRPMADRAQREGALSPPNRTTEGDTEQPVHANPASIRQALIRGMIMLAPAPLHLQIEFAADFPCSEADPIVLAARSHAINRTALGSLRRIQWETPERCSLWFGDGGQRHIAAASFDAQGKVVLPQEYRQRQENSNPEILPKKPPAPQRSNAGASGAPAPAAMRERKPGTPRPRRSGAPPRPGESGPPEESARPAGPTRPDERRGPGVPADRNAAQQRSSNPSKPTLKPATDGNGRGDRQQKPAGRSAAFPANSMLADKLRAALAPVTAAATRTVPSGAGPAPTDSSSNAATEVDKKKQEQA